VGGTSTSQEEEDIETTRQKRSATNAPLSEVPFDDIGHLPVDNPNKDAAGTARYRLSVQCALNVVYICLTSEENCYLDNHTT